MGLFADFRQWQTSRTDRDGHTTTTDHYGCSLYYVATKSHDIIKQKYMVKCPEYTFLREKYDELKLESEQNEGKIVRVDIVYDPTSIKLFETNEELEDVRDDLC